MPTAMKARATKRLNQRWKMWMPPISLPIERTLNANAHASRTTDSTGNITITSSGVFTLPTSKGTAITITVDASDVVIKGTGDKESEEEIVVTRPNARADGIKQRGGEQQAQCAP